MEDNEFEEVTIISHTDHGTSVLSESLLLRLLKKTTLEVTQEIGQFENKRSGSLLGSSEPTVLDSVYRDVIKNPDETLRTTEESWLAFGRLREPASPWLMFSKPYLLGADPTKALPLAKRLGRVYFILEWVGNIVCFPHGSSPKVLDRNGTLLKQDFVHEFSGYLNSGVSASPSHCYFSSMEGHVVRLDTDLVESVVPDTAYVQHFQVCWLTQTLVIIDAQGQISRGGLRNYLDSYPENDPKEEFLEEDRKKYYLKQMYSGHFVLTVGSQQHNTVTLHLLHRRTLETLSHMVLPCTSPYVPQLVNLLKPTRSGGQLFILTRSKSLLLLIAIGSKLHQVSEVEVGDYVYCLGFDSDHNWIIGGTGVYMASVRIWLPSTLMY